MAKRPLAVWRVRGWQSGSIQYGGWQAICRRCGWFGWATDQSGGFDLAYDHVCPPGPRFEPDIDLLYRQGQGMGMW